MNKIIEYLESSFLGPYLCMEDLTDLSYNGRSFFIETSSNGRSRLDLEKTNDEIGDFLRHIANLGEKQFSNIDPIMDLSFGKYRLNASFRNIGRADNDEKCFTFCLRLASKENKIEKDSFFWDERAKKIILTALKKRKSIVIGGITSSGKTELQRYLVNKLEENTRVICIDNVEELSFKNNKDGLDLTVWHEDERSDKSSYRSLVRNALRNNPDYIIVSESRGKEMLDVLNSVMSGHPIITTIHVLDIESIPYRMGRLAMQADNNLLFEELLKDITYHFDYAICLKKLVKKGNKIRRYVESIGKFNAKTYDIDVIYRRKER